MKLYLSPTSPYVRKVRVFAHERGLADRIELAPIDPWSVPDELTAITPLGKVPALVTDDGLPLTESHIICEYLDSLEGGARLIPESGPRRWSVLRLAALGQGLTDATLGAVVEQLRRPAQYSWPDWIARQRAVVSRTLAVLERDFAATEGNFAYDGISIACALAYLDMRMTDIGWRESCPKLAAWFAWASRRPSMEATAPK